MALAEADPETEPDDFQAALERYEANHADERQAVLDAGGLHILGTERHESRRVDNQLRGRSGRQGDPGSSRFFLSLEDDLMRIFGSDRIQGLMGRLGMQEGEAIEAGMVSKAIERAQTQVEGRNFEVRKHLLEYDDVMNKQREAIYALRAESLEGGESRDYVLRIARDVVDFLVEDHCPEKADPRDWDLKGLATEMLAYFDIDVHALDLPADLDELGVAELEDELWKAVETKYQAKEEQFGEDLMRAVERDLMLRVVDHSWKEHLLALDHLKEGIGLRGYGQRDPLQEYKKESYELFEAMRNRVEDTILKNLFRVEPVSQEKLDEQRALRARMAAQGAASRPGNAGAAAAAASGIGGGGMEFGAPRQTQPNRTEPPKTVVRDGDKVGRNDPCPCGSGKKYKKCCLANEAVAS
jgi:preprotein translocase subunit SecA